MVQAGHTIAGVLGLLVLVSAGPGLAAGLNEVSGVVVASVSTRSGPTAWREGGLGKLPGEGVGLDAQATIAYRTQLTERVALAASVDAQLGDQNEMGLGELYVVVRPDPSRSVRFSGRAGMFFPPVSLEHDGLAWALNQTVTPSAANSWVAEEVKVIGVEVTAQARLGFAPVTLSLAAFKADDTAGALIAFRGWALHPYRGRLGQRLRLPQTPDLFKGAQAPLTHPIAEVDGRWGLYGRAEVRPLSNLSLAVFGYDNRGDETSLRDGQYAWRTRFAQMSLNWSFGEGYQMSAQVLEGRSAMGRRLAGVSPVDIGFQTAFVLISREIGQGNLALRGEQFSVADHSFKALDNNSEQGRAVTLAWTQRRSLRCEWISQFTTLQSRRPDRRRLGGKPSQAEVELRTGLRWTL